MTKCIAFHSYKGGTGKTTLACNSAGALTKRGFKVCLLDLDIYAPSFQIYFQREPPKGINNFLDSAAKVEDVMFDATEIVNNIKSLDVDDKNNNQPSASQDPEQPVEKTGKLWVGFSSPLKKDIFKLEMADKDTKKEVIRRFINLRERLVSEYDADYIILDTSPGMRFWSINTLAIADVLLLTLKNLEAKLFFCATEWLAIVFHILYKNKTQKLLQSVRATMIIIIITIGISPLCSYKKNR